MKKFLTVLLVIAVMFTFSFGSAFAAYTADADFVNDTNKAAADVTAAFETAYNTAVASYVAATTTAVGAYPISKEAWLAGAATYKAKALAQIDANVNTVYTNGKAAYGAYSDIYTAVLGTVPVTASAVWTAIQGDTQANGTGAKDVAYRQAFNEYKAAVATAMRSVDSSVFSAEKVNDTDEYTQQGYADAFKEEQAEKIEAITVASSAKADVVEAAFAKIGKFGSKAYVAATGETEESYTAYAAGVASSEAGIYTDYFIKVYDNDDATQAPIKYVFALATENNIVWNGTAMYLVSNEAAAGNVAKLDAIKAAAKAELASKIASLRTTSLGWTKTQKANVEKYIAAAQEIYTFLIDNSKLNAAGTGLTVDGVNTLTITISEDPAVAGIANTNLQKNVEAYKDLETYAAKLAAETKDGALVRDAAKIEKVLAAAKKAIYNKQNTAAWAATDTIPAVKGVSTVAAKPADLIKDNCYVADVVDEYAREVALAAFSDKLDGALYDAGGNDYYYTKEAEEVKALYAAVEATIKAAQTDAELAKATDYTELDKAVAKIKKIPAVNALIDPTIATEFNKLNPYVDYAVSARGTSDTTFLSALGAALGLDAAYNNTTGTATAAQWTYWYAEEGARSADEVKALYAKAQALVDGIPTKTELDAEKAAVEALVAALPATITAADKDAVIAAQDAFDAYAEKVVGATIKNRPTLNVKISALKSALEKEITTAVLALPAGANAKAENKEAFKAAEALMDAYNDIVDDYAFAGWTAYATGDAKYDKVQLGLTTIKNAELKAIKDAINALPINITEANRADVEAITALYDAYVAEYSDPTVPRDARDDFWTTPGVTKSQELKDYEAALETLEDLAFEAKLAEIKAVESLKLTASSTAAKGSITVKWTVAEGDVAAADGFQVWKSTKHSSGYKKMFTTTKTSYKNTKGLKKGTRYYYKVRAYKVVDGKNVYSDWSNKARRIAK